MKPQGRRKIMGGGPEISLASMVKGVLISLYIGKSLEAA
jgi:hypothetical protein